jgi:hypothetical protein
MLAFSYSGPTLCAAQFFVIEIFQQTDRNFEKKRAEELLAGTWQTFGLVKQKEQQPNY